MRPRTCVWGILGVREVAGGHQDTTDGRSGTGLSLGVSVLGQRDNPTGVALERGLT